MNVLELKEKGNESFRKGDMQSALAFFNSAIELDHSNPQIFCNRSMCFASIGEWEKSRQDAQIAITLQKSYEKAHFRLVKALLELRLFREASRSLLFAIRECGESTSLRSLEEEFKSRSGLLLRPKPNDFDNLEEIGSGNFSKIFKATLKFSGKQFAMKVIEKSTVSRMKRRHGNIENEILMEKRVLQKICHPNVIELIATFQDFGTLYFQMEYLEGGEVWSRLHDRLQGISNPVGCYWSMAAFFCIEILNALEYMHRLGIVHRDIKPENVLVDSKGHIKLIDFGTAKDLIQTDLNGPEFVGTPEYMSPSTVASKNCGPDADLWALGILLFQMLLGYTPFSAASPYLTFLRIKKANLKFPSIVFDHAADFLSLLLERNSNLRLKNAIGNRFHEGMDYSSINYNKLKGHRFFDIVINLDNRVNFQFSLRSLDRINSIETECVNSSDGQIQHLSSIHLRPATCIPTLKELCIRAVGAAALIVGAETSSCGGIRPSTPWIKSFDLNKVSPFDKAWIAHYLDRHGRLHSPVIYRLFWRSVVDARCIRTDAYIREYLGFSRHLQGLWSNKFFFMTLSQPLFGASLLENSVSLELDSFEEEIHLRRAISSINKARPKFVIILGNFSAFSPDHPLYDKSLETFRRTIARLSDTIPILFAPGDLRDSLLSGPSILDKYRKKFGADYYGFWFGGVRILVLNSSLFFCSEILVAESTDQLDWFEEEIQQAKLCATHVLVVSYHSWAENDSSPIPVDIRERLCLLVRHVKVRFVVSANSTLAESVHFSSTSMKEKCVHTPKPTVSVDEDGIVPLPSEIVEAGQNDGDSEESEDEIGFDQDCSGPLFISAAACFRMDGKTVTTTIEFEEDAVNHYLSNDILIA